MPRFISFLTPFVSRGTRDVRAVDDISFRIAPGEMVGYVGPNGAGKSTTILYLDEPTIGLDVVAKGRIREFLLEINRARRDGAPDDARYGGYRPSVRPHDDY